MSRPTTVSILTKSATTTNLTLNYNAIKSILTKVGDKPLCIISINGKFRKGKSLMLNFFLQYLRARQAQNTPHPENWFQPSEVGRDFSWRGGSAAETNGILIYSDPFEIDVNGESIAVLLMDTQGSFDDQTSFQHNAVIFALSSLLSSVMVMNIEIGISEDMLQFLQFFAGFAQLVLRTEDEDRSSSSLFAQSLLFLVRDFQWVEEFKLGMHDDTSPRPNYKKEKLDPSPEKSREGNFVREEIREMFPRVAVNLLPYPGNALANKSLLDNLDPDFQEEVVTFVENIFASQNIVKKTISGEVMTGNKLKPFLQRWQTVFEKDTPTVKNLTEATAEVQNIMALTNAERHFELQMKEFSAEHPNGVSEDTFNAKAEDLKIECFAIFKHTKKFGKKEYEDKFSEDLNKLMKEKIDHYRQLNSKRVEAAEITMRLEQEKEQLTNQLKGTIEEYKIFKEQSSAEIKEFERQLIAVTEEMNISLDDNKKLREQHQELDTKLHIMKKAADDDRQKLQGRIAELGATINEQAKSHEEEKQRLHRAIKKASKSRGFFSSFLGKAVNVMTLGAAEKLFPKL